MTKQLFLCAVAAATLLACGDNQKVPTDSHPQGGSDSGSGSNTPPPPPTLGVQIDRLGRPAVNTALNMPFAGSNAVPSGSANASKDAYNADGATGSWAQTWVPVFYPSLAVLDALDTGLCGNGICELDAGETTVTCPKPTQAGDPPGDCGTGATDGSDGCGNQAFFGQGGPGYGPLATVLSDDELYLDTTQKKCTNYLAVEFYTAVLHTSPASCGGRAPSYDVIDTTYTLAAIGTGGFDPTNDFAPAFGDKVDAHSDISDTTFPFLGAPH